MDPKGSKPGPRAAASPDVVIVSVGFSDVDELASGLRARGIAIERAHEPETVAAAVVGGHPSLSVVDLRSADGMGFRLLTWLCRNASCDSLVITEHRQVEARLRAISIGAVHHVQAPFDAREAIALVEALTERARVTKHGRVEAGDIAVDSAQRCFTRGGETMPLTPRELDVLMLLIERSEQPVAKRTLLGEIWDDDSRSENVVEANVSSLRRKLHALGPPVIHTVHRKGYVFRPVLTSTPLSRATLVAERDRLIRERNAVLARRDELVRRVTNPPGPRRVDGQGP
jgi:DNA-binding response OmpR family regulator